MSKFRFFVIDHSRGLQFIFFAKFLEILTTGTLEIGTFLLKQSVSIFGATAHALHLTGFFRYQKNLKIARFFVSLPFLTYHCNKIPNPSIHI